MPSEDPRLKAIRIKTGVVNRAAKEKLAYQKEAAQLEAKLEAFKASDAGADDHAVAKQQEVYEESRMMIPDATKRLKAALDELQKLIDEAEADPVVKETEIFTKAQTAIVEAKKAL